MAGTTKVRSALLVLLAVAGLLGAPASSADDDRVPAGWRVARTGDTVTVTWHSASRLPMGDARPEFRLRGDLLGYPRLSPDGHRLTLSLPPAATSPGSVSGCPGVG